MNNDKIKPIKKANDMGLGATMEFPLAGSQR